MTTETNTVFNTFKEAFAPVTEAFKNFQNLEVPEAARDFVKKQAETAKVRAADFYAGSEKASEVIEIRRDRFGQRSRQDRPQHPAGDLPGCRGVLRRRRQACFGEVDQRSRPDPVGLAACAW